MNKVSRIFQPLLITPKNATVKTTELSSKSHKLMLEMGLIRPAANGMYHILPLFQRSLEKAVRLIDETMREIGGQKLTMPVLTPVDLWKKSGRFTKTATDLMTTRDRHDKEFILSPTHEEAITSLLASVSPLSYRSLPLKLYQITSKFRDELKPRSGLLRTREFLMKDLYTFDSCLEDAKKTYEEVNEGYERLFRRIGVEAVKVQADSGMMGGTLSHEYHLISDAGEDVILNCPKCAFQGNQETFGGCEKCDGKSLIRNPSIEVAHAFLLGDRYTKALGATCLQKNGKPSPMVMGCFGVGVTRLIAAALEVRSSETELRWPPALAPFRICFIPPKQGSHEEATAGDLIAQTLQKLEDFVVDDRPLTVGKRLLEAKRVGYPLIVIAGSRVVEEPPQFEVHDLETGHVTLLSPDSLLEFLSIK